MERRQFIETALGSVAAVVAPPPTPSGPVYYLETEDWCEATQRMVMKIREVRFSD